MPAAHEEKTLLSKSGQPGSLRGIAARSSGGYREARRTDC
jgi:hypothetical protein